MINRQILRTALVVLSFGGAVHAGELPLKNGLYEVRFRLELPHLEHHAVDRQTTICIDRDQQQGQGLPLPLLSQAEIFSDCQIDDVRQRDQEFSYDILCAGRGSGRASATYVTAPGEFKSRISITQGGKNMTMTEVQHGRRLGNCDPPT